MERDYEFSRGVLTFNVDTADMDYDEFDLALTNAIGWSKSGVTVDMSLTGYISSRTIGQLTAAAVVLRSRGRKMTVIAAEKIATMLERTGFGRVGAIEKIGP